MIISHINRFAFIHNPKAAGSSVRKALQQYHDHPENLWGVSFIPILDRVVDKAHLTLAEIATLYPNLNGYHFFVVVRDPLDRYVSSLKEHNKQHYNNSLDLDKLAFKVSVIPSTIIRFNWKYIHFCPQHYFFKPTEHLEYFFRNLQVFTTDNLHALKEAVNRVTIAECPEFSVENYSSKTDFSPVLPDFYDTDAIVLKSRFSTEPKLWRHSEFGNNTYSRITRKASPYYAEREFYDDSNVDLQRISETNRVKKLWS